MNTKTSPVACLPLNPRAIRNVWDRALLTLAVILGVALPAAAGAASLTVQAGEEPTSWSFSYGPQKLLVYSFDPQKFKPYVKELDTLKGDNILRDAPFDHLHHHALMYGIKVNGINFWEEVPGNGVEKVIRTSQPGPGRNDAGRGAEAIRAGPALGRARRTRSCRTPRAVALLVERRTLTLRHRPSATGSRARMEIGVPGRDEDQRRHPERRQLPRAGPALLAGASIRLAQHLNSGGQPDLSGRSRTCPRPLGRGLRSTRRASRPPWPCSAIRANARGDASSSPWSRPFAYLSATQGLDKEPLIYHRGDTVRAELPGHRSTRN